MTAMEAPGSADVELDLGVFPVIPVQLGIFSTPSARCVNVTCWVPSPKSAIFLGGVFVAQGLLDFSVTAASLATTHSLPVKVSTASVTLQVALVLTLDIVNVSRTLKVLPAVNANPCTGTWPKKTPRDVQHASVM